MKITTFETGFFRCDGGSMFGLLPKQIWQRHYPYDNQNLCPMTMRCMLVETNKHKILFDTGIGINSDTNIPSYGFFGLKDIASQLISSGISTSAITHVVLSHLHFDHCGALTYYNNNGELQETFQNAIYCVGKEQLKQALDNTILDSDSFIESTLSPLSNSSRTVLIEDDFRLCKEVHLAIFNGHTPGQLVGFIGKNKYDYIFAGDVLPLALNVRIPSISSYDLYPLESAYSKLKLLKIAAQNSSSVILYHDVKNTSVKVKGYGSKYRII